MLAFMSSGHTPGRGKYGDVIEDGVVKPGVLTRGKKYMLSKAQPTGLHLVRRRCTSTALSTLCLAEMYGMDPDPDLEEKLRKAVDLIVKSQSPAGGWRYTPAPTDQDLSVTVMQVVALRAANNAGVPVPQGDVRQGGAVRAVVRRCAGGDGKPVGGFGYQGPGNRRRPAPAACSASSCWAITTIPTIAPTWRSSTRSRCSGANDLQQNGKDRRGRPCSTSTISTTMRSRPSTRPAARSGTTGTPTSASCCWSTRTRTAAGTCRRGRPRPSTRSGDKVYPTAMATLILNIYRHYLPAYQR